MKYRTNQSVGRLLLLIVLAVSVISVTAQQKEKYTVAIFLYQGVELLDFAGPGEVFSAAGFNVYTVSVDGKEILSQGFVTVKPGFTIENAPVPDVIVFPGGHSTPSSEDPKVMSWLKARVASGTAAMSVCTGAEILGNAGLLKGFNVTTFHGFIPRLQAMLPDSKVLTDTRFVDNGNIITTAGVSAGIDGALHLVSRIKGLDVAKSTAFYMEYDKWKPEEGRVDYKNEYLEKMKAAPANPEKENKTLQGGMATTAIPYEGELKNLAKELRDQGSYQKAAQVLESPFGRSV
jgi:transcriptional regulator GlxA family with amidase domain